MPYVKNTPLNKNPITAPLDEGTEQEETNDIKVYGEPSTFIKDNIILRTYKDYKILEICKKLIIIYDNDDVFDILQSNDQTEQKIKELRAKREEVKNIFR